MHCVHAKYPSRSAGTALLAIKHPMVDRSSVIGCSRQRSPQIYLMKVARKGRVEVCALDWLVWVAWANMSAPCVQD